MQTRVTADHPIGILCRSLEAGSNNGPDRAKEDDLNSAYPLCNPSSPKTTNETTQIVNRILVGVSQSLTGVFDCTHDSTLEYSSISNHLSRAGLNMSEVHFPDGIVNGNVDASHHALIITEKENGQAAEGIDGNKQ